MSIRVGRLHFVCLIAVYPHGLLQSLFFSLMFILVRLSNCSLVFYQL